MGNTRAITKPCRNCGGRTKCFCTEAVRQARRAKPPTKPSTPARIVVYINPDGMLDRVESDLANLDVQVRYPENWDDEPLKHVY